MYNGSGGRRLSRVAPRPNLSIAASAAASSHSAVFAELSDRLLACGRRKNVERALALHTQNTRTPLESAAQSKVHAAL
eukprot:5377599-Prymnesium_polylepis.1